MDETLLQLFRELLASYDPEIDTTEGSPFYTQVMSPLLRRIGPDLLSGNAEDYVVALLDATYGDEIDTGPLSDLRNLLIRPMSVVVEGVRREISKNRAVRALSDFETMTRAELAARLTDHFTTLKDGGTVALSVRVYFPSPQSRTFTTLTRFYTGAGLNFYPTSTQAISSAEMSFQVEGSLFYVDVDVQAEDRGSDYVIAAGAIIGVEGIAGVARVTNLRSAAAVENDETKAEGVERAQDSITQRTLTTSRGIRVTLPEDLGAFTDLKVIRAGHALMQRDQVYGPVAISGIPGGVRGRTSPDLAAGAAVHIGAHTDVYVRRGLPSGESLDVSLLQDVGFRVFASPRGYTAAGAATNTWEDATGNFVVNGIRVGDILRVDDQERQVTNVTAYALTFSGSALPGGQFGRTYEIVRKTSGYLTLPLYDLVAEEDGAAVVDDDLGPIRPVPGDPARTPLVVGGSRVASSFNRATENVVLPILRITEIEVLDSLTFEPTDVTLPMAHLLGVRSPGGLAGGGASTKASGRVRCYFRDAISVFAGASTAFKVGSYTYRLVTYDGTRRGLVQATGRVVDQGGGEYKVTLTGTQFADGRIVAGDRVVGTSFLGTYAITGVTAGSGVTVLTVREEGGDWFEAETLLENVTICPGSLQADLPFDDAFGLYYLELEVEASAVGAGGDLAAASALTHSGGVVADGWRLKSASAHESFSSRDLPYLEVSAWPEDETYLLEDTSSYALRITYDTAPYVQEVQSYVEDDDNGCVGEDLLVRHFLPSYVRALFVTSLGSAGKAALDDAILALRAGEELQVSDLGDALKAAGANYTKYPTRLVVLQANGDRTWTLLDSQDKVTTDEGHNFLPDGAYLSASAS